MLNELRHNLRKLLAPGEQRKDAVRVRWQLERLEDRMMLNASYGPTPHGNGNGNSGLHNGNGPHNGKGHFVEQAAYASAPHESFQPQSYGMESYSFSQEPNFRPSFGSFQPQPSFAGGFQEHPQRFGGFQNASQYIGSFPDRSPYVGDFFDPPQIQNEFPVYSPPQPVATWSYEPVWEVYIIEVPVHQVSFDPSPIAQPILRGPSTSTSNAPSSSRQLTIPDLSSFVKAIAPEKLGANPTSMFYDAVGSVQNATPTATTVLALASSATDLLSPAATPQMIVHEGSTATILAATARDLVFKDYAPTLFSMPAATSVDRANLAFVGADSTKPDGVDGLILPHEQSVAADIVRSDDAVTQEREAVNVVLEQLENVDVPQVSATPNEESARMTDSSTMDLDLNFDLVISGEDAGNEIPAGEIQAGMVLLPSIGDASESKFDMTPVYAAHVEQVKAPTVEASVGLFQAIDVAADDSTAVESGHAVDAALPRHNQLLLNDQPASERTETSSRKTTTIMGAATLTGALIWMGHASTQREVAEATPKRHSRHNASSR